MYLNSREEKRAELIEAAVRKWNDDFAVFPRRPSMFVAAFLSGLWRVRSSEVKRAWEKVNNLEGGI